MIKFVVFDFDGVFTDGSVIFDNDNNIIKQYNVIDGVGIKELKNKDIEVGCISGYKENQSQRNILEHLNIKYFSMGSNDKLNILKSWIEPLNITLEEVAFMGDDVNDIEIMNNVKLVGCPKNSHKDCLELAQFISEKNGGEGCVREFCDYIKNDNKLTIFDEIKKEFFYQINNFNLNDINKISNSILNISGNIYFIGVGKSGNMSKQCSDLLKSVSIKSIHLEYTNLLHGDLGVINDNDLVILFSNSGNTYELVNIIKYINFKKIGICSNSESKFNELCDETLIIPFNSEISGEINKIPTNSCMSQLLFSNLLISNLKKNIDLENYKMNHPMGQIGKNLLKIKDVLIKEFPKLILDGKIELSKILLEMTKYKIGCCFFINKNDELIGILTDGDIRRILIDNPKINIIFKENINKDYYYETDMERSIFDYENYYYIPITNENNKIIGIVIN